MFWAAFQLEVLKSCQIDGIMNANKFDITVQYNLEGAISSSVFVTIPNRLPME